MGAVNNGQFDVVGTRSGVILLDAEGRIIDQFGNELGVPAGLKAVGTNAQGQVFVAAAHGLYQAQEDFLAWQPVTNPSDIQWSQAAPVPAPMASSLRQQMRHLVLPWDRVLLDIHSGRIIGPVGPWLMDAAAIFLIFLGCSGAWIWLRQRRKIHAHTKSQDSR